MHFPHVLLILLSSAEAALAQAAFCFCQDQTVCSGEKSQCTPNSGGWKCCAPGQKWLNGACWDGSATACADGKTICSGTKPQCTTNSGIFGQGDIICCASGQQANSGKCYPGKQRLVACYADGPCDLDKEQYCAWTTSGGYSRCCKRNQWLNNWYDCLAKP